MTGRAEALRDCFQDGSFLAALKVAFGVSRHSTILRVPMIRTIVFWGLHYGPPILGNYHMLSDCCRFGQKFRSISKQYLEAHGT